MGLSKARRGWRRSASGLRVMFNGQTIADTVVGLSRARNQPSAGLLHSARAISPGHISWQASGQVVPGANSRATPNTGRSMSDGKRAENAAWSYPFADRRPSPISPDISPFMPRRSMNAGSVNERVQPQQGDFYGGWITSRIVGPFKGGTRNAWMVDRSDPTSPVWAPPAGGSRCAARSLYRLRHLAFQRSQAMRPGLPVHQAGLSRAGNNACTAAPAIPGEPTRFSSARFGAWCAHRWCAIRARARSGPASQRASANVCWKPAPSMRC